MLQPATTTNTTTTTSTTTLHPNVDLHTSKGAGRIRYQFMVDTANPDSLFMWCKRWSHLLFMDEIMEYAFPIRVVNELRWCPVHDKRWWRASSLCFRGDQESRFTVWNKVLSTYCDGISGFDLRGLQCNNNPNSDDIRNTYLKKWGHMPLYIIPHPPSPLIATVVNGMKKTKRCIGCGLGCNSCLNAGKHMKLPICSRCKNNPCPRDMVVTNGFGGMQNKRTEPYKYTSTKLPLFEKQKPDPFTVAFFATFNGHIPPYAHPSISSILQAAKNLYPHDPRITFKHIKQKIHDIGPEYSTKGKVCRLVAEGMLVNPFASVPKMQKNIDLRVLPYDLYERIHRPTKYVLAQQAQMERKKRKLHSNIKRLWKRQRKRSPIEYNSI